MARFVEEGVPAVIELELLPLHGTPSSASLVQIAQMASCYLTGAYILKSVRPPDSRPPAMWPSLQIIFHCWGIRRTLSERENAGSP